MDPFQVRNLINVLPKIGVLLVSIATLSCEETSELDRLERIPQSDRIIRPGDPADLLTTEDASVKDYTNEGGLRLTGQLDTLRVGVAEGTEGIVFGKIVDVVVTERNSIIVLDGLSKRLITIDTETGAVLAEVGRAGGGPKEFALPRGLAYDKNKERLFVIDARGTLKIYSVQEPEGRPTFVETVPLTPGMQDACVIGDTLYFHNTAMDERGVIARRQYQPGDTLKSLSSFGRVYDAARSEARWRMRRGEFGCSPDMERIGFAPSAIGDIRMYSGRGELLWYSVIKEFRPISTYLKPGGGVRQIVPKEGFTTSHALTLTTDGSALLQLARKTPESRARKEPFSELTTYYLSRTGQGEFMGDTDVVYWHVGEQLLVASRHLPYPQMIIVKATES